MTQNAGALIMFDGPDGVGKTTQFELAAQELEQQGHKVFAAHQLGGTEIGEALRSVMFSDSQRPAATNLHISLAIYCALAAEIEVKRNEGYIILIDRSPLSLIAYAVYGDGLDEKIGFEACDASLQAFKPDKIILYEASLDTLQKRRTDRSKATDYFEQQSADYHQRTTEGYTAAAERYRPEIISAEGSPAEIHAATMAIIKPLLTEL